jgi:peptidoglycan hydrolase CwlO-like protein
MKMKKGILVLVVSLGLLSIGFMTGSVVYKGVNSPKEIKTDSLTNVIYQKDSIIEDLEYQVEIMSDEIQVRESEISYWGCKYDSLRRK